MSRYEKQKLLDKSRSDNPSYGNIDDLDITNLSFIKLFHVSRGRGSNDFYGNIDDLNPLQHDADYMEVMSLSRAGMSPSNISYPTKW